SRRRHTRSKRDWSSDRVLFRSLAVRLEPEDAERGDHARDTAEEQTGGAPRAVAAKPRRARDEVHALDEPALLVRGDDDDLAAERGDVVRPARARPPDFRMPVVGVQH